MLRFVVVTSCRLCCHSSSRRCVCHHRDSIHRSDASLQTYISSIVSAAAQGASLPWSNLFPFCPIAFISFPYSLFPIPYLLLIRVPHSLLNSRCAGGASTAAASATAATGGGAVSAEEMQAAMRSVEDETDAAAAAALEQENAAELAEFTVEPAARVSALAPSSTAAMTLCGSMHA